jgi:hypothetical protein
MLRVLDGRRGWRRLVDLLRRIGGTVDTAVWSDLLSLARTSRFIRAAPRIIFGAGRRAAEFARAFDRAVRPHLDSIVEDPLIRAEIAASMLSYATKSGFVVAGYAGMTGVPFSSDLAVLGLSFTRLYDDLLDEGGDPDLARRLNDLIAHGRITPCSDVERLLGRLYREIDRKADREGDDPLYTAAAAAHGYQAASRCQSDPSVSYEQLVDVTRGKGRYGTLTVFALVRPRLSANECELIMEVGEALQMLDDYADVAQDRLAGSHTMATEGWLSLADVASRFLAARPRLAAYFGRREIREFLCVCHLAMWICFLDRRWPGLRTKLTPKTLLARAAPPARTDLVSRQDIDRAA